MKKEKIKVFVSMHDEFYVPNNKLLFPIQVGSSIAPKRFENMLHDDVGENISEKNKMYCELTAQYWAWKNQPDLDYYGFFHYRRYLSFNPRVLEHWENIVYFDYCDEHAIKEIMLDEDVMCNLITKYDVIYPQANPIGGDTIYEHWEKHLEKTDIDTMIQVIMDKYPEFYEVTKEVINSKEAIHCNMFIMKRDIFNKYCEWLFDILEECEKRTDHSNYSTEKYRTIGHFAERLCAIYAKYLEKNNANICYLQRTLFRNNERSKVVEVRNEKNFVPIVLSCNDRYVKYLSVLLESIIKNSSKKYQYNIYVLNQDISNENEKIIEDQIESISNIKVEFINVKRRLSKYTNLFVDRHLSVETYFRFFCADIFPDLDKILYLDTDTIVDHDISALFFTNIGDKSIGAVRDADIISLYPEANKTDVEVRPNIDQNIGLKDYKDYFQAGVLLFNLKKIRDKYTVDDLFEKALSKKWKFQDQDVLNHLFSRDVFYLDMSWNTLYECFNRGERIKQFAPTSIHTAYEKAKKEPKIIHYAGTPKPWEDLNVDMALYFWKYAQTTPFFEVLLHELNFRKYNSALTQGSNVRGEINDLTWQRDDLSRQRDDLLRERDSLYGQRDDLYGQRDGLSRQCEGLIRERDELRYSIEEIRKSFSYRLGLAITYLPRKIREIIRRK